jgi:hypothetical protein
MNLMMQRTVNHRLLILVSGIALLAAPATAQQKIDMRRAATPEMSMRLSGAFGSLKVVGWAKDSIVITGTLPKGARVDGGLGGTGNAPTSGGKFYVEQPLGTGEATGSIEIYLPERARFWSKAGTARIDVSGISGGLDLNIVGGSITVTGNPRELNVESMDGSVEITGSPSWMRVKTATGDITMRGSSEDAAFTSISGTTRISDGRFERARVESVTGATHFSADIARSGTLTLDSHSGALEFIPTMKSGIEIEAHTITGRIENGVSKQRPIAGREGRGEELALRLGSADARATLRSFKGNIRLAFR